MEIDLIEILMEIDLFLLNGPARLLLFKSIPNVSSKVIEINYIYAL